MYFCATERFNVLNFTGPETCTFGAVLSTLWSKMSDFIMCLISGQCDTRQKKLQQLLHKNSKTIFFDFSDDGDDDFPVGSGSGIESETEEEYTESDTTDEDELE